MAKAHRTTSKSHKKKQAAANPENEDDETVAIADDAVSLCSMDIVRRRPDFACQLMSLLELHVHDGLLALQAEDEDDQDIYETYR